MHKYVTLMAIIAMSGLSTGTSITNAAATSSVSDCPVTGADEELTAEEADGSQASTCDLIGIVVTNGAQAIPIPEPGTDVTITDLRIDGTEEALSVAVAADGTVSVDSEFEPPLPPPGTDALDPCTNLYAVPGLGKKWYAADMPMPWYINRSTVPTPDITRDAAVSQIRSAIQNIANADNECGLTDNVSASATYEGDTETKSPITQKDCNASGQYCTSVCPSSDEWNGTNTVFFGTRHFPTIATTCSRGVAHEGPNRIVEADMEIDRTWVPWTTNGGASSCDAKLDLQNVATHEFGHWFGLAHSNSGSAYRLLTMYPGGAY